MSQFLFRAFAIICCHLVRIPNIYPAPLLPLSQHLGTNIQYPCMSHDPYYTPILLPMLSLSLPVSCSCLLHSHLLSQPNHMSQFSKPHPPTPVIHINLSHTIINPSINFILYYYIIISTSTYFNYFSQLSCYTTYLFILYYHTTIIFYYNKILSPKLVSTSPCGGLAYGK